MDYIGSVLLGQPAYKILKSQAVRGSLSHAVLVTGDTMLTGEFLKLAAATALCPNFGCMECSDCRRALGGTHPDVLSYPQGEKFAVSDIEKLIEDAYVRPMEGDRKVLLLHGCESMNASTQNKLLKTLEEPPRGVHMFLSAANLYDLLPTVRSRLRLLELRALSPEVISGVLERGGADRESAARAAALCGGSLDLAEQLSTKKGAGCAGLCAEILERLKDEGGTAYYAGEAAQYSGGYSRTFLAAMQQQLRVLLRLKNRLDVPGFTDAQKKEYDRTLNQFTNRAIIEIISYTGECALGLHYNANFGMTVDGLLLKILSAKRGAARSAANTASAL